MSEKIVAANVSDCRLSIQCGMCGTSVVFDFTRDAERRATLQQCPRCGTATGYDANVPGQNPPEMFRQFLAAAAPQLALRDGRAVPVFTFGFIVPVDADD